MEERKLVCILSRMVILTPIEYDTNLTEHSLT